MKARLPHFALLLPALLAAGCGAGLGSAQGATGTVKSAPAVVARSAATTRPAPRGNSDQVRSTEAAIEGAWARLTAMPGIVPRGGYSRLYLDVWSDDDAKKIKSYEARWYATEGHLTRWLTRNEDSNGWFAPFSPFYQNSIIQTRVDVTFEDDTTASGRLSVGVWVQ